MSSFEARAKNIVSFGTAGHQLSVLFDNLKPDMVLALKIRAARERDRLRENRSLLFSELLHRINLVNRRYTSLIAEERRREGLNHATGRR